MSLGLEASDEHCQVLRHGPTFQKSTLTPLNKQFQDPYRQVQALECGYPHAMVQIMAPYMFP